MDLSPEDIRRALKGIDMKLVIAYTAPERPCRMEDCGYRNDANCALCLKVHKKNVVWKSRNESR